jgi:DNA-binding MarR family transcriptional regulator
MAMEPMKPADPQQPRALSRLPSWLVGQVARHANRIVSQTLGEAGVRKQHFAVLTALEEQGSASQAALGRRVWMDRSDLHAVLNDLERDGLVARVRDERDRRRNLIALTPAGREALKQLNVRVDAAQAALLEPLSSEERRELRRLLSRLEEHHAARRGTPAS